MGKINILFCNQDGAGVFYWRTQLPAIQLAKDYSDEFNIEINKNVDWNDAEYLKKFQIIHGHRTFMDYSQTERFTQWCKENNIVTILDIDDSPELDKTHPMYTMVKMENLHQKIYNNIKNVDYVTTTTNYFSNKLMKYNKNVVVLPNAVNTEVAPQFKYKRVPSDKVRTGYIAGSSHGEDIKLLSDIAVILENDLRYKDIYQMVLCGFDTRGHITEMHLNHDFQREMHERKIIIPDFGKQVNNSNGDISKISGLPDDMKLKYKDNFIVKVPRPIKETETCWENFEKLLLNDRKLIKDEEYLKYLLSYSKEPYANEKNQNYVRRWTLPVLKYAEHYDYVDISLAPLMDSEFNRCKSPLKFVEAFNKKTTVIASDIVTYNEVGKHEKNCLLVKPEKGNKGWIKAVKRLYENPSLREDLASQLYEDMKVEYDLTTVTKKRAEFYKQIVEDRNKV